MTTTRRPPGLLQSNMNALRCSISWCAHGVGVGNWAEDLDYIKAGLLILLQTLAGLLKWVYDKCFS